MKIKFARTLALSFIVYHNPVAFAQKNDDTYNNAQTVNSEAYKNAPSGSLLPVAGELLYGYGNFSFNSVAGLNFNNYKGVSKLYSVGADQVHVGSTVTTGIYLFRINTTLNSNTLLLPNPPTSSSQDINNNTLFGHVMNAFTPQFYVDLSAGLGQNSITNYSVLLQGTPTPGWGIAHYSNNNWFGSLNAIYNKPWKDFILRANAGVLYTQIHTGFYIFYTDIFYPPPDSVQVNYSVVTPLTTKATLVYENAELAYNLMPGLSPFVNAALIQVAQFSNSRPLVSNQINGSLPLLDMNQNGYRVGAGVLITRDKLRVRIEDKYYNAQNIFISNQVIVGLEYQFS